MIKQHSKDSISLATSHFDAAKKYGNFLHAEIVIQELIDNNPNDKTLHFMLLECLTRQENSRAIVDHININFEKIFTKKWAADEKLFIKIFDENVARLKDYFAAKTFYEKLIELGYARCSCCFSYDNYRGLGRALYMDSKYEEAVKVYKKFIDRMNKEYQGDHYYALVSLGESYLAAGKYKEAATTVREAINIKEDKHNSSLPYATPFPANKWYSFQLRARALMNIKKFEQAISCLKKADALKSEDIVNNANLAICYAALREKEKAISHFELTVEFANGKEERFIKNLKNILSSNGIEIV